MDNNQNQITETPEELELEKEAQIEVQEEELRTKLAEDLGIDADDESELLDKLVEREKLNREKLSGAIKQKINWRTKAQGTSTEPDNKDGKGKTQDGDKNKVVLTEEEFNQRLEERFAERDLKEMNLPEDIEKLVRDLAKVRSISVREAVKDSYVVAKLDEIKKQEKVDNASPRRSSNGSYKISDLDLSKPLNPADFDLNSEEGRKAWKDAKAAKAKFAAEKNK